MSDELILDALNPPNPTQLVNDLKSVGAVAVGVYVLRRNGAGANVGIGSWTPDHVIECLANDIGVFGIIVPGNNPLDTDPQTAMSVAVALGIPVGVMAIDIENFSEPRKGWVTGCITELSNNGWFVIRYGDVSDLANYTVAEGDWISHGYIPVSENQLSPMPALPAVAGVVGDQYTVGAVVNGNSYDGSVFDSSVVNRMKEAVALTQGFKVGLAHVTFYALYGRGPTENELFGLADSIADDGANFGDLVQGLTANLSNADVLRLQATTLADEVDALKNASVPPTTPTLVQHTHPGGQTGSAVAS